ncbi:hypothetical protein BLOT_009873 [Blomia tropicalis]|nr:hypothetical protein BLOT_009873 [Blomia tropicalis]
MSQIYFKLITRQMKSWLFLCMSIFRRLLCCFRSRTQSLNDSDESFTDDEMIFDGNFVIVQQQQQQKQQETPNPLVNSTATTLTWASSSSDMFNESSQQFDSSNINNYSNYSLVNQQQQQQQFSPNNIGSRIDIGPNRTTYFTNQQQQQPSNVEENEPDFFQDMIPKFCKPKTLHVATNDELNVENISEKFRIDERRAIDLDQSRFRPFGSYTSNDGYQNNQSNPIPSLGNMDPTVGESNWDEDEWQNLDQSLAALRRETREQRRAQSKHYRDNNINNNNCVDN